MAHDLLLIAVVSFAGTERAEQLYAMTIREAVNDSKNLYLWLNF
jgi:hypothetical protein